MKGCRISSHWTYVIYLPNPVPQLSKQGVPILVCQTKLGDRDHRSKKILSKDSCPEMNRLASRRM